MKNHKIVCHVSRMLLISFLILVTQSCDDGAVTEEQAAEAARILREWQLQNK